MLLRICRLTKARAPTAGNGLRNSENQSFLTKRKAATSDVPNYFAQGSYSTTNIYILFSPLQHARNPFNEPFSFLSNTLSAATMDEISQEDELIAQFAGVASVPASEVMLLAPPDIMHAVRSWNFLTD
jgi:hypothetical protein